MTRAVDFALDDNAVAAVAVMTGDQERQQAGDEEENAVPGQTLAYRFPHIVMVDGLLT